MAKLSKPRRGSLAYWPRVRARRIYPRIRNWPEIEERRLLGFAAYKAGMLHLIAIDNRPYSPTKGEEISMPITVLEAPPLRAFGIRLYKRTTEGLKAIGDIIAEDLAKELGRKIRLPKERKFTLHEAERMIEEVKEVRLLVHTQPKLIKLKKKPEVFEIAIGGKSAREKLELAKGLLGREIKVSDAIKPGEQVDVIAVTKGKGFAGPVKRFGVKILPPKTKGIKRKPGALSSETPRWILPARAPMAGQLGYFTRTEYNKWVLAIGSDGEKVTPAGGFHKYGRIASDYLLIKGSVPGPVKRLIRLRLAIRPNKRIPPVPPQIIKIVK